MKSHPLGAKEFCVERIPPWQTAEKKEKDEKPAERQDDGRGIETVHHAQPTGQTETDRASANTGVAGTTEHVPAWAGASDNLTQGKGLLPIIPNVAPFNANPNSQYQPGQVAKMCIAQQGWTSVGLDSQGSILVQHWVEVVDEADGWVSLK